MPLPKRMLIMHNQAAQVPIGHKSVRFGQDPVVMELPLWNAKRYAPYKLAALVEVLAEQGIPPEASLSGTGLSAQSLADSATLTSVRQYITVCQNALHLSKDPETPFRVGSRIPLSAYGMYGFALVCSPTIREYFQVAVKYHRLATPLLSMSWREEGDSVSWVLAMNPAVSHPDALVRFLIEQQLTQLSTHLKTVVEHEGCSPVQAALSYSAPAHTRLYKRYLGCPVRFSQPMYELTYPRSILSAKPLLAHGLTSKIMRETCDRILGEVKTSTGVAGEVYQIIASTPGHSPSMGSVAAQLATTARTLNRKLHAEGTSFTQILDDVRCNLAKEYLRSTKLSTEDISELVGFSEASNFRHAFRRWTGSTPARYRP
jgi:AraC-like DNA-binding protein